MKLMWINTGRFFKCYSDDDGQIMGAVREHDDGDGTYIAIVLGENIGSYINQDAAVVAVAQTIRSKYIGENFED